MKIKIIVGSVTGTAESVARHLQTLLEAQYEVELLAAATAADLQPDDSVCYLFCTSNTGAGDLPPALIPLFVSLKTEYPRIAGLRYGLVNLGNSGYVSFAQAGHTLDEALLDLGAQRIGEMLVIDSREDIRPVDVAEAWLPSWLALV